MLGFGRTSALGHESVILETWVAAFADAAAARTFAALAEVTRGLVSRSHGAVQVAAVQKRVKELGEQQVTAPALSLALGGEVSVGTLNHGLDVLLAGDWDGRRADLLIVLGVHDKGIGARPSPDPLVSDAGLGALGPRYIFPCRPRRAPTRWPHSQNG